MAMSALKVSGTFASGDMSNAALQVCCLQRAFGPRSTSGSKNEQERGVAVSLQRGSRAGHKRLAEHGEPCRDASRLRTPAVGLKRTHVTFARETSIDQDMAEHQRRSEYRPLCPTCAERMQVIRVVPRGNYVCEQVVFHCRRCEIALNQAGN